MKLFDLSGKVAVVLGGSGVLGSAMSEGLAEAGAAVAVCGTKLEKSEGVATHILQKLKDEKNFKAIVKGFAVDATDIESLKALKEQILNSFGQVDILVNGVGGNKKEASTNPTTTPPTHFFDLSGEAVSSVMHLNLMAGAILPSQVFGKVMAQSADGGNIINITSMAAFRPLTRIPGYAAAKAAVSNFTQWLAVDLAKTVGSTIRVNAIAPGFFLTEQNRFLLTEEGSGALTQRGKSIIEHTPMNRFGNPEDLIGTLVWLASDASRFVTGIVVPVDGGFSAFSGV